MLLLRCIRDKKPASPPVRLPTSVRRSRTVCSRRSLLALASRSWSPCLRSYEHTIMIPQGGVSDKGLYAFLSCSHRPGFAPMGSAESIIPDDSVLSRANRDL